MSKWLRGMGLSVGGVCGTWIASAVALDHLGGRKPPSTDYGAVVVAGAGVYPGGVPSPALERRTRVAVDEWHAGTAPRLALTGGLGDWPPAEAVVSQGLALGWGVPAEAIVVEDRSTSTEENARELRSVLGDVPILVVTDRYHVMRCERVFSRYFSEVEGLGVKTPTWVRVRGALREVLAVTYYWASGRM